MFEAPYQERQLAIELLGIQSLNSWAGNDAPSRIAMANSHLTQSLPISGGTIRRQQTGAEPEYAKYTHKIAFPCNAVIEKVIRRFPPALDMVGIESPTITVMYRDIDTNKIGALDVPYYHSLHQYFGFKYVQTPLLASLAVNMVVEKGAVLAHSPSVTPSGRYKYGIEAQIAFMSFPTVIEDGIAITDRFAEKCKSTAFVKRRLRFSDRDIPLNTYGSVEGTGEFKIFPDIGQRVRSDGLLFASRKMNPMTAPFDMLPENLMKVGYYDEPTYGVPNAKVVDITVIRQSHNKSTLPMEMLQQVSRYFRKNLEYYEELLELQRSVQKKRGMKEIPLTPRATNLLTRAVAVTQNLPHKNSKVELVHGEGRIDEWEVEITLEYDIIPTIGYKFTDGHGCKGIVCDIIPWQKAPVDAGGNVVDIIADAESPVNRSVMGRLYEHYTNASMYNTWMKVRAKVDAKEPQVEIMKYIRGFYSIMSPTMLPYVDAPTFDVTHHINCIYRGGLYIDAPPDAKINFPKAIRLLQQYYPPVHGPVRFINNAGKLCTSKRDVIIGGVYVIMLEKIGNVLSAVSSAAVGHYGIPAKLSKVLKNSKPGRESAIRVFGEAESRSGTALVSSETIADLLDKTNSPRIHEHMCDMLLTAPVPSAISVIVDRKKFPIGGGRTVAVANTALQCSGIKLVTNKTCSRGQLCRI